MSEFDEFFKVISEGKKQAVESSPGKKLLRELQEDIKQSNPFADLKIPERSEVVSTPVVEVIAEQPSIEREEVLVEVVVPEVKPAAEQVPMSVIDKYLKQGASFQQPNPDTVDPNIRAIQDKLKFMEQWLGKIAATGPGGGAGEIYNLDMPTRVVTGDYLIGRKDYYVGVNADVKTYITLPTPGKNLKDGRVVVIKDESGHAQLTPIKIVGTVDNDPNGAEIRINNGAVQLLYRNGSWRII